MTTNDEPYVPYRPSYVAGLERRVEEQREAIEKALEALEMVEWVSDFDFDRDDPDQAYYFFYTWCPWCKHQHDKGHADDCPRQAALAELRRVAGLQMR